MPPAGKVTTAKLFHCHPQPEISGCSLSLSRPVGTARLARLRTVVAAERGAGPGDGVAVADHAAVRGLGRHEGVVAGRVLVLQPRKISRHWAAATCTHVVSCQSTSVAPHRHCSPHTGPPPLRRTGGASQAKRMIEMAPAGIQHWTPDSSRCGRRRSAARWQPSRTSSGSPSASEPADQQAAQCVV